MEITTTYIISTPAEFKEAIVRLGGECEMAPCFNGMRTVTIVDEEEYECEEEEELPLEPHPDDAVADHLE